MARTTPATISRLRFAGALLLATAALLVASTTRVPQARAATATWDGGGADNHWTTPQNWIGDVAPNVGDDLVFPATAQQLVNKNDYPAGTAFNSIRLGLVTGYVLTGNRVAIGAGGITAPGGSTRITFDLDLPAGGATFRTQGFGTLILEGDISLAAGPLSLDASGTNVHFQNGSITGSNGVTSIGAKPASYASSGSYTYSGRATISTGIFTLRAPLPNSPASVSGGRLNTGESASLGQPLTITGGELTLGEGSAVPAYALPARSVTISGGSYQVDLNGTAPGTQHDQLRVTGAVSLSGSAALVVALGFTLSQGQRFTIIDNDGSDAISSAFSGRPEGSTFTVGSTPFRISYTGSTSP